MISMNWLLILFLPLFAILMVVVFKVLSVFDPWKLLVQQYAYPHAVPCKMKRWQSALVDGSRYRACLHVGWDDNGIYFAIEKIFRWGHPTIHIPWNELVIKRTDYWTWFPYEIHPSRLPTIDFRIRPSLARKLITARERANNSQERTE